MMNIKQKKKEKKKKEREQKKREFEHLYKMFMYDEDGKKRTKVQINKLILKNLKSDFKESNIKIYNKSQTTSEFIYKNKKEEIEKIIDGEKVKKIQIIETDF